MRRVTDPMGPEVASFYAIAQVDGRLHYLQEPMMTIDDMVEWHKNKVIAEDAMLISNKRQCAIGKESVATIKKQRASDKAIREARKLDSWVMNPVAKAVLEGASRTSGRKKKG
jgi:hypothetical protein